MKHKFCKNIFYIPNPTQYLNLTTTLLTINKQNLFITTIVWMSRFKTNLPFQCYKKEKNLDELVH